MNPLALELRQRIAQRGPIPFREFMEAALYHPQHGYYASGRAVIGRQGDFFTNSSVGPLFGQLLARQFLKIWEQLGSPTDWTIVEQGAHRGEFAGDALAGLRAFAPAALAAVKYVIVEPSAPLRAAQQATLRGWPVQWVSDLANLATFTGVHFSNELLDAFPVHLVVRGEGAWRERHVDLSGEGFVFTDGPLTTPRLLPRLAILDQSEEIRATGADHPLLTEINLAALDWLSALSEKLVRGCVLAIDYGYTRGQFLERRAGTLSAYAAHRREPDPLARPGEIDLTAHVEFTSLLEHADALGFRLNTFTDQHRFMVGLGTLHFTQEPPPPAEVRAFKTLMHPGLLGQSFKVLCLEKS